MISDGLGQPSAYHVYYPYGEEATAFNQDTIRTKFTGHERDLGNPGGAGDDLDYMHARHCSPLTGRFLSIDPSPGNINRRKPQAWNRYSYAFSNPLRYIDPNGQEARMMIDQENHTIYITAEIDIWGEEATDEIANEIETSIETVWNGHTYTDTKTGTDYKVVVDVTVTNVGPNKRNASALNRIHITSDIKDGRDYVITAGRVDRGAWKPKTHPMVRAHEFGHLVGLPDDYFRRSGAPKPGHNLHLMGGGDQPYGSWRLHQHEIVDVVGSSMRQFNKNGTTTFRLH